MFASWAWAMLAGPSAAPSDSPHVTSAPARLDESRPADSLLSGVTRLALALLRDPSARVGSLVPTYYQTVDESNFRRTGPYREVYDLDGRPLAMVPKSFCSRLNVEGAGRLRDGRTVTYAGRIDNEIRFGFTDARYGLSFANTPLVPFRTVAVDRDSIEVGALLFVPAAVGIGLPGGGLHDGIFYAEDVGSAINGSKLDFYVGFEDHVRNRFSTSRHFRELTHVEVYRVPESFGDDLLERRRRTTPNPTTSGSVADSGGVRAAFDSSGRGDGHDPGGR